MNSSNVYAKGTVLVPKSGRKWSNYHKLDNLYAITVEQDMVGKECAYARVKIKTGYTYSKEHYMSFNTADAIYVNLCHFETAEKTKVSTEKLTVWF